MANTFGKVYTLIWADPIFLALDSRPQRLFMMLVSYPTRNFAGVLPMTINRWVNSAADLDAEMIRADLLILALARFIVLDEKTEEVLIRTYIRWDELWKQPNYFRKVCEDVLATASPMLRAEVYAELGRVFLTATNANVREQIADTAKQLVTGFKEGFPEGFLEGFPEGLSEGIQEGIKQGFPQPPREGSVVVVTKSGMDTTTTPTATRNRPIGDGSRRSRTFTDMAGGRDEPLPMPPPERSAGIAATAVASLVSKTLGHRTKATQTDMRLQAGELQNEGVSEDLIRTCLEIFDEEPEGGRRKLRYFLVDAERRMSPQRTRKPKTAHQQSQDRLAEKQRRIEEEIRNEFDRGEDVRAIGHQGSPQGQGLLSEAVDE